MDIKNDFSNFTRYKSSENKPQRFPKKTNFDIDNLDLEEEDPDKNVQQIQKNNKESLLDQNYMSNDSLLFSNKFIIFNIFSVNT